MNLIGNVINGYHFIGFLGEGGFGSVYEVEKNGQHYAIKVFREAYVLQEYKNSTSNNRIQREIDIMKSVSHPSLIRYIDDFKETINTSTSYFLVMEYAKGPTLREVIDNNLINDINNIIIVFKKIVTAIKALHHIRGDGDDTGIIHRDLKPENIIVTENNNVKILDYGISKVIDYTTITSTGQFLGSPLYSSPEQITDSKHLDKRSDLYTLGVIYYELLTKKYPYTDYSNIGALVDQIKNNPPIPPRRYNSTIDNKTENIILKLLEKEPYKRFQKVDLLLDSLNEEEILIAEKLYDLKPKIYFRLYNEKAILTEYIINHNHDIHVDLPINHQYDQKNLLNLLQTNSQFDKICDPATVRFAYDTYTDVKGLNKLPYCPSDYEIITPSYLDTFEKQKQYVQLVIDEQLKVKADILISPYHYSHNTNIIPTVEKNHVAEWFDLDLKLLKESIDYKNYIDPTNTKKLYAGIALNAKSLSDPYHKNKLLNEYSAHDCDGFIIYAEGIDYETSEITLFHYVKTLLQLQENTGKPVIAGRINTMGLGLLCLGITGYSTGTARFESFYEDLYKERSAAYNMYDNYYFPALLRSIAIAKKSPIKYNQIIDNLGSCSCLYCRDKELLDVLKTKNTKLHFLEIMHQETDKIISIDKKQRLDYFKKRIDFAIQNYQKLTHVFKPKDYAYLNTWKKVFSKF